MQKIRLFFILFMFPFCLLAQQRTKIILQDSRRGTTDGVRNISYLKNPVFRHENATLTCDSAVYYESRNVFEAFNNVHINQSDTINIYSDHLTYDGNTKIAHLTNNVKMIDKETVLTTNILDYNMATKIGTYLEGGKIVNKDVTLTSKRGFYFSGSRDAYFRYNVVVVTPQSRITSDTLRYNTLTNWAYFYGPTNIKGKDDNLYTENGAYNTKTDYAFFGKRNLYTNGSKSLKGDSLYYDGIAGYGKAVKNIVFKDTSDKTVMYGQLGYYYKADERAVVTKNAYIGLGTSDSILVNKKNVPDSLWLGADTLETQMVLQKSLVLIESPILKKDNELGEEGEEEGAAKQKAGVKDPAVKTPAVKNNPAMPVASGKDSLHVKPGSLVKDSITVNKKDSIAVKDASPPRQLSKKELKQAQKEQKKAEKERVRLEKEKKAIEKKKTGSASTPSIQKDSLLNDSLIVLKKDSVGKAITVKADSILKKTTPKGLVKKAGAVGAKPIGSTSKPKVKPAEPINPMDTVRTRAIKAYHHVRVYKANMQAVADSLFYTNADSTLRWYGRPILWSQGSQQAGDTIYLRLKNKKLNTLQVIQNGFLVNVNADSAKFNQVKGKLITGFFKDGELNTMFVDGNAESVYYNRDKDSVYTEMNQTVSSRIKMFFQNKEITKIMTIKDPEGVRVPIKELKEDVILTGFIWKPELRPLSKKEVINGKAKPKATTKGTVSKKAPAKSAPVKKTTVTTVKGLLNNNLLKQTGILTDSLKTNAIKAGTALNEVIKKDSVLTDSLIKKLQTIPLKKL